VIGAGRGAGKGGVNRREGGGGGGGWRMGKERCEGGTSIKTANSRIEETNSPPKLLS